MERRSPDPEPPPESKLPQDPIPLLPEEDTGCCAGHLVIVSEGSPESGQLPRVRLRNREFEVCSRSLYVFPLRSCVRRRVIELVTWWAFDKFILFLIFFNSICLASYDHRSESDSGFNWVSDNIFDPILTSFFTLEFILKVIAFGFVVDKTSYLRDAWNWLDFIVVVTGVLQMTNAITSQEGVGFLRMFRILRPLRSLNAVPQMKVLVNTVLSSIPRLGNVSIMAAFLFVSFGIVGVSLFGGVFHRGCHTIPKPVLVGSNGTECWSWPFTGEERLCGGHYLCEDGPGGSTGFCGGHEQDTEKALRPVFDGGRQGFPWCEGSAPFKVFPESEWICFDHMGSALITIFQCMTLEGWTDVMYRIQDGHGMVVATVYFFLLIPVTSFFLLNVALAVVDEAREDFAEEAARTDGSFGFGRVLVALVAVMCLSAFLFQSPLSCKTISAKLSAVATGFSADPSLRLLKRLGPAPAALQAAPAWSLRGKDPCVPVLGQQVALGARAPFQYVPSAMEKEWFSQPRAGGMPKAKLFNMASTPKWRATILKDDFLKADYRSQFGAVSSVVLLRGGQINQKDWWDPLPDHLRARTRFYNVAVNETHCALTATGIFAEKGSFLHMLPYAAKPDDYVVVKLDVRSGPELAIMEALARHPELSALVDEVFLEYRFDFDGKKMDSWWKFAKGLFSDSVGVAAADEAAQEEAEERELRAKLEEEAVESKATATHAGHDGDHLHPDERPSLKPASLMGQLVDAAEDVTRAMSKALDEELEDEEAPWWDVAPVRLLLAIATNEVFTNIIMCFIAGNAAASGQEFSVQSMICCGLLVDLGDVFVFSLLPAAQGSRDAEFMASLAAVTAQRYSDSEEPNFGIGRRRVYPTKKAPNLPFVATVCLGVVALLAGFGFLFSSLFNKRDIDRPRMEQLQVNLLASLPPTQAGSAPITLRSSLEPTEEEHKFR
eukprot:s8_g49.t1